MAPSHPESPIEKHLRRMMDALAEGRKRHAEWLEKWERMEARERARWERLEAEGHEGERHPDWEKWAERYAGGVEQWAQRQARQVEAWAEKSSKRAEKWASRVERQHRRKELRRERREQRRERERARKERRREEARANPFQGAVFAAAALVMVGMAIYSFEEMWWLIFVALGLGSSAAGTFWRARQLEVAQRARLGEGLEQGTSAAGPVRAAAPEPAREGEDPRRARVDTLCDKLLGELRSGPGVLRDVVHQPEQTVEGLRKSCHELARRERELRSLSPPEEERRLEEERARLSARVESETDAVVKERLEKTLRLLDEQRQQRAELATAASRLEAEHMRLFYTLENLYTQVLRVRSADAASADVAGAGLRQSVEQLGLEMDAVASALEEVHGEPSGIGAPRGRVPTR
ncbi:hypothetical protein [Cystobacter ferrugineus]|uniref:Uncharacterized protein n=1 Tax=Cystobacter ferrugineus TaxID=83449 RepID=A0A1L9AYN2_9BACT|nr:hypothetical protein [Cystobacter ferrugineus]OJH35127.1 hypothetical protein BON30_39350 [Cystobacter ferrugineus]